jgi:uncharacterized protein (TIGR03435 family)
MNAMFLGEPWVARLGWTLVHFLWQGLVIAASYTGTRVCARHSSPHRRYLIACAALATMLASPILTYCLLVSPKPAVPAPDPATAELANPASGIRFAVTAGENATVGVTFEAIWSQRVLPCVVMLWIMGALVFAIRLAGASLAAARLQSRYACSAPNEWQRALDLCRARLQIGRSVRLLVSGLVEAPVTVGWLRPAVLVPIGALVGVPAEHMEALLLHELAHIRRHDYMINVMQNIGEALLFYHPAVWWISGQIRAERELCCDDVAVAATGDALTYALALAGLEASRPAHTQSAVAANGGLLADRIARLLGQARPETRTFTAPGAASAVLLAITAWVVCGQPTDRPRFEVASVKPSNGVRNTASLRSVPGGRLSAQNYSVRNLIMKAYDLHDFQIAGGPQWLHDTGFDIEAKGAPNATRHELMLMLQSLLEERFQLRYRRETREVPVYVLTVIKSGSKLPSPKPGGCVNAGPDVPVSPADTPCGNVNVSMSPTGLNLHGGNVPMPELIRLLSSMVGRPVLDRTGITTNFDLRLQFTVDDTLAGYMGQWGTVQGHSESLMAAAAAGAADPRAAPNILGALQEQLGLKLEGGKGPAEVMVIDQVGKPGAN